MVTNFTVCRNFSHSALHCCHHSQNTFLAVFIQNWNCFKVYRNFSHSALHCCHLSLFSSNIDFFLILHGFCMVINSHTCHIMTLYDYQFSFYGKVPGNFKMPLFILVCLWAIELTSQKLILFAVLVSLFEPLREWLIFYRGWNLMGIAHYAIRLVIYILISKCHAPFNLSLRALNESFLRTKEIRASNCCLSIVAFSNLPDIKFVRRAIWLPIVSWIGTINFQAKQVNIAQLNRALS